MLINNQNNLLRKKNNKPITNKTGWLNLPGFGLSFGFGFGFGLNLVSDLNLVLVFGSVYLIWICQLCPKESGIICAMCGCRCE